MAVDQDPSVASIPSNTMHCQSKYGTMCKHQQNYCVLKLLQPDVNMGKLKGKGAYKLLDMLN